MQRVTPDRPWQLFDVHATRRIEQEATARLPAHTLMQRAGLAVARLATAVAPHACRIWIACGPGNNGGDGLEAAVHLRQWGRQPVVTWLGTEDTAPEDALASLQRARAAGVEFTDEAPPAWELGIDALLGIGASRVPQGRLLGAAGWLNRLDVPLLAVDIPTGLAADTGDGMGVRATHTLSLLGLKPGLFTAQGRDAAGEVWLEDLGVELPGALAGAWLAGPPPAVPRRHATHKGTYGDVAVIGGAPGMAGAARLAASAALHGGAGRVFVGSLDPAAQTLDPMLPDLMLRRWEALDASGMVVVAGCGGGDAIREALPRLLSTAPSLVLDADGLNAVAADAQLQALLQARGRRGDRATVLTPHPLEAARLLEATIAEVQAQRLGAAGELARRYACTVVLKGSGTVTCSPGELPVINPTGNARLASAGTGDVLAGMVAARLAHGEAAFDAARHAVYLHGAAADGWSDTEPLTASALARRSG